jgi:hypothetical protein
VSLTIGRDVAGEGVIVRNMRRIGMSELSSKLMSTLNVQEGLAKGGAGLLFKLAQEKLGGDFSRCRRFPEAYR